MARRCATQPANAPKSNDKPPQLNANDRLLANQDMDLLDEFLSIHEPDDCKQHNFSHYMGVEDESLLLTPTSIPKESKIPCSKISLNSRPLYGGWRLEWILGLVLRAKQGTGSCHIRNPTKHNCTLFLNGWEWITCSQPWCMSQRHNCHFYICFHPSNSLVVTCR